MKNPVPSKPFVQLLIAILILQSILLGCLFVKASSLDNKINQTVVDLREDEAAQSRMLYNEIDYQKSLQRPTLLAKENLLLFPELKITLPYNDVTKTLQYSAEDQAGIVASITSTLLDDHKERQLGCSWLVGVNLKDGKPLSPWDEAAGSVKLSDGRTLYIVAAKAFKDNEGSSTEECATEAWRFITPKQVADEFKKAQSY